MKLKGFTLAEVLITLGIIGVVAAMTMPTLISKIQKQEVEANLKETYSILQQTMRFAEYDEVAMDFTIPDNLAGMKTWYTTFIAPHMKVGHVCFDQAGCWHSKMPTRTLAGRTATWNRTGIGVGGGIITVKLTNGANICFDGYSKSDMNTYFGLTITDNSGLIMYIDANGDKKPNMIGKDIFIAGYKPNIGIVPAGSDKDVSVINQNCSPQASGNNAGYFCLLSTKNNGWSIPINVWKLKK